MKILYISESGKELDLYNSKFYHLKNPENLISCQSELATSQLTGDGDEINSARRLPKEIPLEIMILGRYAETVDYLLRSIISQQNCELQIRTSTRQRFIKGFVSSINFNENVRPAILNVTIHCSFPLWQSLYERTEYFGTTVPELYFTNNDNDMLYFNDSGVLFSEFSNGVFTVDNRGNVPVPFKAKLTATQLVENPKIVLDNGDFLAIGDISELTYQLMPGNGILLSTERGNKYMRTEQGENLLQYRAKGSKWLCFPPGVTRFYLTCSDDYDASNLRLEITYRELFI